MFREIAIFALAGCLAAPAQAGSTVIVNKAEGWDPSTIAHVAVVVTSCSGSVNCDAVTQSVAKALLGKWSTVPTQSVSQALMKLGAAEYSEGIRAALTTALSTEDKPVQAIVEVSVPFTEAGGGWGTDRRTEVVLKIVVRLPGGAILMTANARRRPKNVVTGPERVLGKLAGQVFAEVFP